MLTLEEDFEPVRTFVRLEVAVKALVKIKVDDVVLSNLILEEAQDVNLTCVAERTFPRATFQWSVGNTSEAGLSFHQNQVAILYFCT